MVGSQREEGNTPEDFSRTVGRESVDDDLQQRTKKKSPHDIFLVHAGPQKPSEAATMVKIFREDQGYNCFFDMEMENRHRSPRELMEEALETCRYAVVILSRDFVCRKHPCAELVYAYTRMLWLRKHYHWTSLWVVMYDLTIEDYERMRHGQEEGKQLPPIAQQVIVKKYANGTGEYPTWPDLCQRILDEIVVSDETVARLQWTRFLQEWPSNIRATRGPDEFPLARGIYSNEVSFAVCQGWGDGFLTRLAKMIEAEVHSICWVSASKGWIIGAVCSWILFHRDERVTEKKKEESCPRLERDILPKDTIVTDPPSAQHQNPRTLGLGERCVESNSCTGNLTCEDNVCYDGFPRKKGQLCRELWHCDNAFLCDDDTQECRPKRVGDKCGFPGPTERVNTWGSCGTGLSCFGGLCYCNPRRRGDPCADQNGQRCGTGLQCDSFGHCRESVLIWCLICLCFIMLLGCLSAQDSSKARPIRDPVRQGFAELPPNRFRDRRSHT